jgi:hypothetical protein
MLKQPHHFGNLDGKQFAEQRADVDAGEEVAGAAGPLRRAGVVPEVWVVKREIHERGHRHRAAFTNLLRDFQCEIVNR